MSLNPVCIGPSLPRCGSRSRADEPGRNWRAALPEAWRVQVVVPAFFSAARDYEIDAERVTGYETDDEPCYCRYETVLSDWRCDDDEIWRVVPEYAESIEAWRLIDGRWLVLRHIYLGEDCDSVQTFFTFADAMPR